MKNKPVKPQIKTETSPPQSREIPRLSYGDAVAMKGELKQEIKDDVKGDIRKWVLHWGWIIILGLCSIFGGILAFFGWSTYQGIQELQQKILRKATKDFNRVVLEQFSETNVTIMVNRLLQDRAEAMIQTNINNIAPPLIRNEVTAIQKNQIDPLKISLTDLQASTSNTTEKLAVLDASLNQSEKKYEALSGDIGLLKLHADASLGSRKAFLGLLAATNGTEKTEAFAKSLITDLNSKYTNFKNERTYDGFAKFRSAVIHRVTGKECKSATEDFGRAFKSDNVSYKQAVIDDIARRKLFYFAEDLVAVVEQDPDLFVTSRAVSSLEKLTGNKFSETPMFSDVSVWWQTTGKTNPAYMSPFPAIEKGRRLLDTGDREAALKCLDEAVSNRSGLAETRNLIAAIYEMKGNIGQATNQLMIAMNEAEGQGGVMLSYAGLILDMGKQDEALEYIEKAMPFIWNAKDSIGKDARFQKLRNVPAFQELMGQRPATEKNARAKLIKVNGIDVIQVTQ